MEKENVDEVSVVGWKLDLMDTCVFVSIDKRLDFPAENVIDDQRYMACL